MNRVLVTGMGLITALGCDPETFWAALLAGKSGAKPVTRFDARSYSTNIGAEIVDFDPAAYFDRKAARRMSRASLLGLYAAKQALQDACLRSRREGERIGVFIGSSQGGFVESEPYFFHSKPSPMALLKPMNSAPASNISIQFNLTGPSITMDTACSSASHAIGTAMMMIQSGKIDKAVVGGTDTVFSRDVYRSWCSLGALSRQNDVPEKACKPFSKTRDGTVLGEGSAMLVLEAEHSARKRRAKIYAEVAGYGFSSDAHHITHPTSQGMAAAIEHGLVDAGIAPVEVDYVNAHGTGTQVNDRLETAAFKQVFGDLAYQVPMSGIKAAVGHTLAASGAIEAIACALAIQTGCIPPTINYEEADPDCDLDYVVSGPRSQEVNVCLSNSFAFGGSNVSLVITKYED
ncbi:MAG: beta-ketoacyl-[acyl-carrier-protein] synthase family protein [Chloroflexota bacterium]